MHRACNGELLDQHGLHNHGPRHLTTLPLGSAPRAPAGVPPAVGLSQATIATSAGAGAVTCLFQGHPEDARLPLVDYPLSVAMLPGMMLGISLGTPWCFLHGRLRQHIHNPPRWPCTLIHCRCRAVPGGTS